MALDAGTSKYVYGPVEVSVNPDTDRNGTLEGFDVLGYTEQGVSPEEYQERVGVSSDVFGATDADTISQGGYALIRVPLVIYDISVLRKVLYHHNGPAAAGDVGHPGAPGFIYGVNNAFFQLKLTSLDPNAHAISDDTITFPRVELVKGPYTFNMDSTQVVHQLLFKAHVKDYFDTSNDHLYTLG